MSLQLKIINPLEYAQWDDLVISTQDYTFFHSSSWARVLCESYHYIPAYFTLFDHNKLLVLLPVMEVKSILTGLRGVSLPFTDYCNPIIDESIPFQDLFYHISAYGKKCGWKYLEIRGGNSFSPNTTPSSSYLGHILDLSKKEEQIFSSLRDSTRRNIKKAISEGVEAKLCNTKESIKEFYRLNCMTRKQHGLPPQPISFFEKVYDHIISKGLGFVMLASYEKQNIAGAIFFHFGEKALFKYGASNHKYQLLRANNLVMWEAIKWYNQNNYKSMCFGRTEAENEGLRRYKTGWGTKERIIKYYRYDLTKNTFVADVSPRAASYKRIFQKTPIPFLRLVGLIMYRHMG